MAGICFGFLGVFARAAYALGLSVGELLTIRFLCAACILAVALMIKNPNLLRLPLRQILISCCLGVFGYATFSTLYFRSLQGVSVPMAAMLLFTFPIWVNLGAHFFLKDKMNIWQWLGLFSATAGLALLLWGDWDGHLVHDDGFAKIGYVLSGLGAAVTYALYVLVSGKVQKNVPPFSSSLYVMLSAGLSLALIHHPTIARVSEIPLMAWAVVIGLAVFSTISPLTFFLSGLQKIKSSEASIFAMIEPVTASLVAMLFLHETLGPLQLLGGALVLASIAASARKTT